MTTWRQALFALVWFRKRENITVLAAGSGISRATGYRYRDEAVELLGSLRCQGERGFALLVGRWRVLRHVTASPNRIGDLANVALVLTQFGHRYVYG